MSPSNQPASDRPVDGSEVTETLAAQQIPAAFQGEFPPLQLGSLQVWPPVVLAPMAGVTNAPFRRLCRRLGAPLCISEMITARPLAEGNRKTELLATFTADETPRSLQLYGTDPLWVGRAVARLAGEGSIDHLDMNFGCPVRKVTRHGGGSALPHKPMLFGKILRAAVSAANGLPVTIKFRLGIDEQHINFLETGKIAENEGVTAIALHARTGAQLYDGHANWDAIAELKSRSSIPVLGNGDIWEAADALRMMRETRCDGVVVGRGCLGRPWLFDDLARMFRGERPAPAPRLGGVVGLMLEHARALAGFMGEGPAMRAFRRHATWYTKGFRGSAELRQGLMQIDQLEQLEQLLSQVDPLAVFPLASLRVPRGKTAGRQEPSLPEGFWDNPDDESPVPEGDGGDGG